MEHKVSDLEKWYDSLSANTKSHLSKQAIWHDRDVFKFAAIACIVGFILGVAL